MKIKQLEWNYKLISCCGGQQHYEYISKCGILLFTISKDFYVKGYNIYCNYKHKKINPYSALIELCPTLLKAKKSAQLHFEFIVNEFLKSEV